MPLYTFGTSGAVDFVMPAVRKQLLESPEFKKDVLQKVSADFSANQASDSNTYLMRQFQCCQEAFFVMLTETGQSAAATYREIIPNEYMGEPLPSSLTISEENGFRLACNTYMASVFQVILFSYSIAFTFSL